LAIQVTCGEGQEQLFFDVQNSDSYSLLTNGNCNTLKYIINTNDQAHPRNSESETLGWDLECTLKALQVILIYAVV
jgi:hypothetical protein